MPGLPKNTSWIFQKMLWKLSRGSCFSSWIRLSAGSKESQLFFVYEQLILITRKLCFSEEFFKSHKLPWATLAVKKDFLSFKSDFISQTEMIQKHSAETWKLSAKSCPTPSLIHLAVTKSCSFLIPVIFPGFSMKLGLLACTLLSHSVFYAPCYSESGAFLLVARRLVISSYYTTHSRELSLYSCE